MRIEEIFENISDAKKKFNEFLYEIKPWDDYLSRDWLNIIREKQMEIIATSAKTQRDLSTLLQKIRSGHQEESEMVRLLDNFNRENPCSLISVEQFLKKQRYIKLRIQLLEQFERDKHLLKEITTIQDIVSDLYDKDVYLLHISEDWQSKHKETCNKQVRFFKQLINKITTEANDNTSVYRVIDCDLHRCDLEDDENKANKCCIYYATRGSIKSKDYYDYSLSKLIKLKEYH